MDHSLIRIVTQIGVELPFKFRRVHGELLIKRHRCVEQAVTVYLPRELLQIGNAGRRTTTVFGRGCPSKRAVDARFIVISGESIEAALKALTDEISHPRLRGFLRDALEEKEP